MGDSACLMHGFSYASAIPNQSKQGNAIRVLGESVSFGRFMTETDPLSWEKWSTFSHKKYVEEAARYAQPGSVAQKKAFFEAHYKKIAAQKAAAAAALLEQENAARAEAEGAILNSEVDAKMEMVMVHDDGVGYNSSVDVRSGNEGSEKRVSVSLSENLENQDITSCSEGNATPQMERPLLKESCVGSEDISSATSKKKSGFSSLKSSIRRKTWKIPSTPVKPVTPQFKKESSVSQSAKKASMASMDKKRPSPKSLRGLISLIPIKEPDKEPVSAAKKAASSGLPPSFSRTLKDCRTPLRTPIVAAAKSLSKYSASTPRSDDRRMKTPIDPSDPGSKTAGPKWHILSTVYTKSLTACGKKLQSPTSSTPFMLRTEERAAKRKQKLEEKFNTNEEQKVQKTMKEKAGNEFRKLSYSFCFKARPLPDFYKERETSVNQMKKTPVSQPQTAVLGRSNSKKQQHGTVSMPPPPPTPKSSTKNGALKNPSKKNAAKQSKFISTSLPQRITHENKSPNIQH